MKRHLQSRSRTLRAVENNVQPVLKKAAPQRDADVGQHEPEKKKNLRVKSPVQEFFKPKSAKVSKEDESPKRKREENEELEAADATPNAMSPSVMRIKAKRPATNPGADEEAVAPRTIEDVPMEILLFILTQLPTFKDNLNARLVNKRWCRVAKTPQLVRSYFFLPEHPWRSNEKRFHEAVTDWRGLQAHINTNMRTILIDWLIEVHHEFELVPKTLHLGVAYLDRFLQCYPGIKRRNFQLIGMTCLWVASKFEDVMTNSLRDLAWICDDAYTVDQFETCELVVLDALRWDTHMVTAHCFLSWFLADENAPQEGRFQSLCNFVLEAGLLNNSFQQQYLPSLIATSAIYVALRMSSPAEPSPVPDWLIAVSEVEPSRIVTCVNELGSFHRDLVRDIPAHRALVDKYMLPQFHLVGAVLPLDTYLF